MTYNLVIVESPAKCCKIEEYLGPGYKCLASFGHLTKLTSLENIDIKNDFNLTFNIIEEKAKQIAKLQKAINNANDIILATDDDREGEAIAWHICKLFKLDINTTKRILFNEITKTAINKSINNPTKLNIDLVYAQQSRQILDLLVGYRISPILWKNISSNIKNSLSAGRCQTPALRLIYDNYKELKDNTGKEVYNTIGYFTSKMLNFSLDYQFSGRDEMLKFLENSIEFNYILSQDPEKESKRNPPQPFTTSSLQQSVSNNFHISPKETMKICQTLYEEGLITYMRTDSKVYSKEFIELAVKFINNIYGKEYTNEEFEKINSKKNKNIINSQEAHEAIRPTNINIQDIIDEKFSKKEVNIYKLIWKNTIQSCMLPAVYSTILFKITAPNSLFYKLIGENPKFLGWQIVNNEKNNLSELAYNYLPKLSNKSINFKKITSNVTIKDLKMHYTEAKLVQLLEEKGIGRPSTFSSLIDKIQERNYVKKENVIGKSIKCSNFSLDSSNNNIIENIEDKVFGNEKNKLIIQPIGIKVIEFLIEHFNSLFIYEYTKNMENNLDLIAKGEEEHIKLCYKYNKEIVDLISNIKHIKKEEICIGEDHYYIIGKYGPIIKYQKDEKVLFKKIKPNLDHELIKEGKYSLEEIIDNEIANNNGRWIGIFQNNDIYLKNGKFGLYASWGDNNISLKSINKDINEIIIDDIKPLLINKIIRKINEDVSIRNGKYGDYIFHQDKKMKKPKFYKLQEFSEDYKSCKLEILSNWIKEKYNIY
tara:strand:+ start:868 stop:3162 length:2295 start_codon:yes stop_codon:yes gene_type:complete